MIPLDEIEVGVTYQCIINMNSDRAPTPVLRSSDASAFTIWKGRRLRNGASVPFTLGIEGDDGKVQKGTGDGIEVPWCFEPITVWHGQVPEFLGDEIAREEREARGSSTSERRVVLGQLRNVIDNANDSHWTEAGLPRVEFFNDKLPEGQKTTREELKLLFPDLVRQER